MTKPLLEYSHVDISYNGNTVVNDISFPVMLGEILCIVGESGSGKSTIIKAAMSQLGRSGTITHGEIWYEDRSLSSLSMRETRRLCGSDFSLVFQDCLAALTPIRRIGDQIYESMSAHHSIDRPTCDNLALELFSKLQLENPERILKSYPFELSGGMGQRVGIAMALIPKPRILFADEPTSSLDTITQTQVVKLLRYINKKMDTTMVLVTHNMGIVRALADKVLVLKGGKLVEFGEAGEVLGNPKAEYTRELLSATPRLKKGLDE